MSIVHTFKTGITIHGTDFTIDEFRSIVHPCLTIHLSYDIKSTDRYGRTRYTALSVPYFCVDDHIKTLINDPYSVDVYITPSKEALKKC